MFSVFPIINKTTGRVRVFTQDQAKIYIRMGFIEDPQKPFHYISKDISKDKRDNEPFPYTVDIEIPKAMRNLTIPISNHSSR